jgi:hypothetical protein
MRDSDTSRDEHKHYNAILELITTSNKYIRDLRNINDNKINSHSVREVKNKLNLGDVMTLQIVHLFSKSFVDKLYPLNERKQMTFDMWSLLTNTLIIHLHVFNEYVWLTVNTFYQYGTYELLSHKFQSWIVNCIPVNTLQKSRDVTDTSSSDVNWYKLLAEFITTSHKFIKNSGLSDGK